MSKLKVNELDTESGTTITVTTGKTVDVPSGASLTVAGTQTVSGTQTVTGTTNLSAATLTLPATLPATALTNATAVPAAQLTGQVPLANLDNAPSTDVTGLQNDIATLALHSATQNNQTAFNLSNAFVDQYEDSTGIDTLSGASRDTSGEYMWCSTAGYENFTTDANTMVLLHMDGANNGTTFTDDSSPAYAVTVVGNAKTVTGVKKVGTASLSQAAGGDYLSVAGYAAFNRTGDFTMEGWVNATNTVHCALMDFRAPSNASNYYMDWQYGGNSSKIAIIFGAGSFTRVFSCTDMADGNWHHWAVVRDSSDSWYFYFDGVSVAPDSGSMTTALSTALDAGSEDLSLGTNYSHDSAANFIGHMDEFRFSDNVRYPSGTTFNPNYGVVPGTSGNYTSTTETAIGTVSKMGIVVLYKNESGTATLSTDLVAEVSSDGGSNWTAAPLTAGGTFSAGILIAKSNDITISNTGTTPKYRISFANQSTGVKETRVYGASLLY